MKRHAIFAILAAGALASPAAAEEISLPLAVYGPGMATRFHGHLPWRPMERSHELRIGEHLSCAHGCVVQLGEGTRLALGPDSEIEGASPVFKRFDGEEMARRCLAVHVVRGELTVERQSPRDPLIVTTGAGVMGALHDADAEIHALPDRAAVVVRRGRALAKAPRGWRTLSADQAHTVTASGFVRSRPIVVVPLWRHDGEHHHPIALAAHGPEGTVGGAWEPVPGAARYRVDIARDRDFTRAVETLWIDATRSHFDVALPEGHFHARVTAEDADGITAGPGAARRLRVVRASLPDGAFMPTSGIVVVPEDAQVRLLASEDVEVSVDRRGFLGPLFKLPAPTRDHHDVAMRIKGDPDTATHFRLERRALQAQVKLTPALPSWPTDRIVAVVELSDPSGHIDPQSVMPDLEVRVGGAPIAVDWKRQGEAFHAVIAGQRVDGPRLVEVFARDDQGKWLGWGFVEVVHDPR